MIDELIMVYGASGCGRGVVPILKNKYSQSKDVRIVFVDDNSSGSSVNDLPVHSYSDFLSLDAKTKRFNVAIANSKVRELLATRCLNDNFEPINIIADNVVIMDDVRIGFGPILSPFVTLTSNIIIGNFFHANLYSYVEHDCVIGDYVTFAPGAKCNGNVHIHDHVYVGSGAVIKQGNQSDPLVIGAGAIIGMGAVVTKSVPAGCVVVGNPARPYQGDLC